MNKLIKTIGYISIFIIIGLFIATRIDRLFFKNALEHNILRIFYSSDFLGHLEPCGWKKPIGGLARRASYIKANTSEDIFILIVDAGDFNNGYGEININRIKAEYLLKGMSILKYDAINLGEKDILLGKQFLSRMKDKYDIPFISANIYDANSNQLFVPPFVIKRLGAKKTLGIMHGGLKVGIFGITMVNRTLASSQKDEQDLYIKDPEEAAKQTVAKLKGKCDIIIALSHLGPQKSKELAQNINGIDVIVCGHYPHVQNKPLVIDNTLVVQSGFQGKYIGDLELMLGKNYHIASDNGFLKSLDAKIQDDSLMVELLKEYKTALKGK